MACDEDILKDSSRRSNSAKMTRPAETRKSLLVDYSKSKASPDDLRPLDDLMSSPTCSPGGGAPLRTKSLSYHVGRSASMSLAGLVKEGRQRSGSFSLKDRSEREQDENDISESSFSLPELDPMQTKDSHGSKQRKSRLGASADTLEAEGDDSFYDASFTALPTVSSHATPSPAPANRRAQLAQTRLHQSMSNLSLSSPKRNPVGPVLSFSIRRRTSQNGNSTGPALSRCKTWGQGDAAADRFHQSLSALNHDMDASEHNPTQHTPEATPAENRRTLLVRHSSVSALQQSQPFHLELMSPTKRPMTPARQGSTKSLRVFQSPAPSKGSPTRSTGSSSKEERLPDAIEIRSRRTRRTNSSREMRHEKRGSASSADSGSSHEKSRSRNGPGALDRHLGRHSLRGSSHHGVRRGSDHSSSGNSKRRGGRNMPTIEVDELSASSQSYFSSVSKCPSTRSAPRANLSKTIPSRSIGTTKSSSRRDLLGPTLSASRRDVLSSARGPSRRDLMQRQLSSRRNLGTNMGSMKCGGNDLMDDSSQFVTGSRIRRGVSCRQLLA